MLQATAETVPLLQGTSMSHRGISKGESTVGGNAPPAGGISQETCMSKASISSIRDNFAC